MKMVFMVIYLINLF